MTLISRSEREQWRLFTRREKIFCAQNGRISISAITQMYNHLVRTQKGIALHFNLGVQKMRLAYVLLLLISFRNSHWELFFFLCRHILVQMAEFKIGKADGIEYLKVGFEICTPSKLERRCKCIGILALSFNYVLSRTYIGPVHITHFNC